MLFLKKIILFFILFSAGIGLFAQGGDKEWPYDEVIKAYSELEKQYSDRVKLNLEGYGDNGRPIYTFVIEPQSAKKNKAFVTFLINNGIHAGEPDGIEASLLWAREILRSSGSYPNVRFVIIPVYNVDGYSSLSCCTRANQNGPKYQGFRANARNLDLNRDFIKADASNTRVFYKIFQNYKPQVFLDNHVSNGADYQYTMTLISSQKDKLSAPMSSYMESDFSPSLYRQMKNYGIPMTPYVNTIKETPDSGLVGFMETPRFSTGYAALFHCYGFVAETHMLKPYSSRVAATKKLIEAIATHCNMNTYPIIQSVINARDNDARKKSFTTNWILNDRKFNWIDFLGYEAKTKPSEISGLPRLYYDQSKPVKSKVKFFNDYEALSQESKPKYYILPQAWQEVVDRLIANGVSVSRLDKDSLIKVRASYIIDFKTGSYPYEGHYLHYGTKTRDTTLEINFFEGDYLIPTSNNPVRFLVETLSPEAVDSYFNWNFFDAVLQQKEYYSDYVFEDLAAKMLRDDKNLQKALEDEKRKDPELAKDARKQLDFIYYRSVYYEKTHRLYPVFRIF